MEISALQAHELLKKNEISVNEILEISIERIKEVDRDLDALPERCFARAKKVVKNIDKNRSKKINRIFLVFLWQLKTIMIYVVCGQHTDQLYLKIT